MPNIREYSAPSGKINPDEKGYAAFETAGRRIGPLYNQSAQDVEKGGKLQDQLISQLERETDAAAAPEVLRGNNGGSSRGGGGGALGRGAGKGLLDFGGSPQSAGSGGNFVDPLDAANAAKWAASAANSLTGKPTEQGHAGHVIDVGGLGNPLYTTGQADSTPTASGSYSQQNPGGLSDTLDPSKIAADLKSGDYLYNQRVLGAARASDYSPATLPYRMQNPAGMNDPLTGNPSDNAPAATPWYSGIENAISNAASAVSNFTGGSIPDAAMDGQANGG